MTNTSQEQGLLAHLPLGAQQALEAVECSVAYPKGTMLFLQGQMPQGLFVVQAGQVKLSLSGLDGKIFTLKVAQPGEALGLEAVVLGRPHGLTAEMQQPSRVKFIKRSDFLRLMRDYTMISVRVAEHLSENYARACSELPTLLLSGSAASKLAKLLIQWLVDQESYRYGRTKLAMTHEEIAQMIGTSRETVTRTFADLRKKHLIEVSRSGVIVHDRAALEALAHNIPLSWEKSIVSQRKTDQGPEALGQQVA